jgi:hypothetical protein
MRSVRYVPHDPSDDDGAAETDGSVVVVEADDGEQFELAVDDELRAVIGAGPAADQLEDAPEEPRVSLSAVPSGPELSPRDIQVRVRGGESPDDLAEDSGTPIEKIRRFAFPVMEERARVGDEARRSRARRDGDGALVPFGETVDRRFVAHGIDPSTVGWDSFRRPDGSWVVVASWRAGDHDRHAHWAFSLAARTVLPADEVGADLLSERPLRPVVRAVPDEPEEDAAEPVESVYDQEAPGTYVPAAPAAPYPSRPGIPTPPDVSYAPTHDTPPLPLRLADPLPPEEDEPIAAPAPASHVPPGAGAVSSTTTTGSIGFAELFDENVVTEQSAPNEDEGPARSPRRKGGRDHTKIPSWDDILLGVRRKQD